MKRTLYPTMAFFVASLGTWHLFSFCRTRASRSKCGIFKGSKTIYKPLSETLRNPSYNPNPLWLAFTNLSSGYFQGRTTYCLTSHQVLWIDQLISEALNEKRNQK